MNYQFEWNESKAASNLKKHGISFKQATTVFSDPLSNTINDPYHSQDEHRFLTIGCTKEGIMLMISHVDREERIRIISARKVTRRERRAYENA